MVYGRSDKKNIRKELKKNAPDNIVLKSPGCPEELMDKLRR